MNEAIKLAIKKGGYIPPTPIIVDGIEFHNKYETICDPLFWQALGKALDWDTQFDEDKGFNYQWLDYAHKLLDIELTGGDEETFWIELLKQ